MDFSSIMAVAQNNSTQAKHEQKVVLKTKLSAPKKAERKKVDVDALRKRREEEEKRAKELAMKPKVPPPAKPSRDKVKRPVDATKMKPKGIEKPKYESKEHERKHKEFMNKMNKVVAKAKSKSNSSNSSSKPSESKRKPQVVKKAKPLANAPTFQDILKMAEKVKAEPEHLTNERKSDKHKPSNEGPNKQKLSNGKPGKLKTSYKHSENDKLSNGKVDKHKHSSKDTTPNNKSQINRQKESSSRAIKREPQPSEDIKSKVATKRPLGSGRGRGSGVPVKKPMLSEAAMAKLAMKEGRRPPPRPVDRQNPIKKEPMQKKMNYTAPSTPTISVSKAKAPENVPSKVKGKDNYKSGDQPGMSVWDKITGGNKDKTKKKSSHRYIDSDDEDDDLDGFIDDGDDDIDYSSAIRDIFGYDKSRYRDEDFDDRTMEAKYADIMKEEVRSTKLGLKEDLEDIALEEEEKRKKLLKKKKKN